jgi:colanic acid/amylovoran biosynthesis protein
MSANPNTKKILMLNAVLTNNGDAALVFGLYESLNSRGHDVSILTMHYDKIKKNYTNYPLLKDRSSAWIFIKLPWLRRIFIALQLLMLKEFKEADVVLGCPGGYMNSTYGIRNKLLIFMLSKRRGKATGIYAQSFGPFNADDCSRMKDGARNLDLIQARDQWSFDNLMHCGLEEKQVSLSNDAAFLLGPMRANAEVKKVAFSVRDWKADGRSLDEYDKMVVAMVEHLISFGYSVDFLSTCQGIEGYVDDSITAARIQSKLPIELRGRTELILGFRPLDELRRELTRYELVIGTRLHMCVMAMKSGVPALNISYEEKGRAMYDYLGFGMFTVDYNQAPAEAVDILLKFIQEVPVLRKKVVEAMASQRTKAIVHLDTALETLIK